MNGRSLSGMGIGCGARICCASRHFARNVAACGNAQDLKAAIASEYRGLTPASPCQRADESYLRYAPRDDESKLYQEAGPALVGCLQIMGPGRKRSSAQTLSDHEYVHDGIVLQTWLCLSTFSCHIKYSATNAC